MPRLLKQIIFSIIFLVIFIGIGIGAYFIFRPEDKPQPLPDGPSQDIQIISVDHVVSGNKEIDVVAKIKNPNNDYHGKLFSYKFEVLDSGEKTVASVTNQSYILSGQSKNIVEIGLTSSTDDVAKINFSIEGVEWEKAENIKDPRLVVKEKVFQNPDIVGVAGRASGVLVNEGDYDLDKVHIATLLYDSNDKIIGLGKTELRTIVSKEKRYFEINWGRVFSTKVGRLEMESQTNILDSDNILKVRGEGNERFLKVNE